MAEQTEQAELTQQSVEDRLAAQLIGPDPEQPEDQEPEGELEAADEVTEDTGSTEDVPDSEAQADEPEYVEVEFSGTTYHVPPELKDALMAQSDYTRKTTELADVRKNVELQQKEIALAREQAAFNDSISQDVDNLKMLDAYITHVKQNTDWSQMDATEAFQAKLQLDQLTDQRKELDESLKTQRAEFDEKLNEQRAKLRSEAMETVKKAIPNFNDEVRGSVENYVKTQGYPDLNIQHMSALDYQVAWKAMQYDNLKATSSQKVKEATPTIKPGSRKAMPDDVKSKLNYRNQVKRAKTVQERQRLAEDRVADIFGG